jgi:uncharacterized protein DUF6263
MSLINRFFVLTLLLAVAGLVSCGSSSGTAELKLGLEQGQTYRTRQVTDQKVKQTMMGREIIANTVTTHDLAFEVTEVDSEGNMTVRVTFERIASEMESGGRTMSFDSAEPEQESNPMAKSLGAMAGQSYTMVLSDKGQPLSITGMDSIVGRMIDSMELANESQRERMKQQFEEAFGEQQSKDMCGQMFGMIPPGPVTEGEQWTCSSSTTAMIPMEWEQTWLLKEIRDDVFVIGGESVTSGHSGDKPVEMGPMKIFMDFDGTQSGTMELDASTGLVVGGEMLMKMVGEQRIEDGPEQLKGQSIPMEMEVIVTWQRL